MNVHPHFDRSYQPQCLKGSFWAHMELSVWKGHIDVYLCCDSFERITKCHGVGDAFFICVLWGKFRMLSVIFIVIKLKFVRSSLKSAMATMTTTLPVRLSCCYSKDTLTFSFDLQASAFQNTPSSSIQINYGKAFDLQSFSNSKPL